MLKQSVEISVRAWWNLASGNLDYSVQKVNILEDWRFKGKLSYQSVSQYIYEIKFSLVVAWCLSWRLLCICGNPAKSLLSISSENPQGFPEFYQCLYASSVTSPSIMSVLFSLPNIPTLADAIIIYSPIIEQRLLIRTSCPKDRF